MKEIRAPSAAGLLSVTRIQEDSEWHKCNHHHHHQFILAY